MAVQKQEHDDNRAGVSENDSPNTFEISPELRQRIKKVATDNNMTVEEYLEHLIEQVVPDRTETVEQGQLPRIDDLLERFYKVREQVIQDSKGQVFEDSAEVLRQEREKRTKYLEKLLEQG